MKKFSQLISEGQKNKKELLTMKKISKINFDSPEWMSVDEMNSSQIFYDLGFRTVNEVLNIRMFDLFNLQDVDNNRAEEFLMSVFKFLYPHKTVDHNIYYDLEEQIISYEKWYEIHPAFENVKVRDVMVQEDLEVGTMLCIFDFVTQAFYKSSEYNNRKYRYMSYSALKKKRGTF